MATHYKTYVAAGLGVGLLVFAPQIVEACQSSHLDRWDRCAQIPDAAEYITAVSSTATNQVVEIGQAVEMDTAMPLTILSSSPAPDRAS